MKVKLRVLEGAHAGKELPVPGPHFVIGRGEGCHLRAKSDMISRRHCAVIIEQGQVFVRDFESKNGTFVNGVAIEKPTRLKSGDELLVGQLKFEVVVDHTVGGEKLPVVRDVKEAAARAVGRGHGPKMAEDDVTNWLEEADEVERARRVSEPDTRQFRLDETDRIAIEHAAQAAEEEAKKVAEEEELKKKKKKEPGKLPREAREQIEAKDTREAAAETLRRLFNRR